jgi:uncharacterized protein
MRDKRLENLFPTDTPIEAGRMIGRAGAVAELAEALRGGRNRVLIGPRRTGKTSTCEAALAELASAGWYVARVDAMRLEDAGELARELTRSLLANRPAIHRVVRRGIDAWRDLTERSRAQLRVELGEGVSIAWELGGTIAGSSPDLDAAFSLAQRLAEADRRAVALFIDEVSELAGARFGKREVVLGKARAAFQRSSDVRFLLAGSYEHSMREIFAAEGSPLGRFGGMYEIPPIARADWLEGLTARFAEAEVAISEAQVEELLDWSEGHPYATMLGAGEVYLAAREVGSQRVDEVAIRLGFERSMARERANHERLVERLRASSRHAIPVLERVATGQAPYGGRLRAQQVQRALNAARRLGLTERGEDRRWRLSDPLFRRYLAARESGAG